jgi:hypothetical protein
MFCFRAPIKRQTNSTAFWDANGEGRDCRVCPARHCFRWAPGVCGLSQAQKSATLPEIFGTSAWPMQHQDTGYPRSIHMKAGGTWRVVNRKSLTVDNRNLVASKAASYCVVHFYANPVFRSRESGSKATDSWAEKWQTCWHSKKKMIGCRWWKADAVTREWLAWAQGPGENRFRRRYILRIVWPTGQTQVCWCWSPRCELLLKKIRLAPWRLFLVSSRVHYNFFDDAPADGQIGITGILDIFIIVFQ